MTKHTDQTPSRDGTSDKDTEGGEKRMQDKAASRKTSHPKEVGGRDGPEPTRYGDWEKNGIISDF